MKKHTSGPWHYVGDSLTHRQFDIYAPNSSPNQHICTVNNLSAEKLWKRDAETALMNARLIAAAPDLLRALVQCVMTMQHMVDSGEWYEPHRIISDAVDVISRATNQNT